MNSTNYSWSWTIILVSSIQEVFQYIMTTLLFLGIFPNLMSFLIFYQAKFRKNACAVFCSAISLVNILILIQGFIKTILLIISKIDPEDTNLSYCKTRLYLRHSMMMVNRTYTIFACAASYALSSEKTRIRLLITRISLTYRSIFICCFLWFIINIHMPFYRYIHNNVCETANTYQYIFSIYLFIVSGILSPMLMIIFSLLTLSNLNRLHRRVQPTNNNLNPSFCLLRRDIQLIRMLLGHVAVYMITTFLYPINMLYLAITFNSADKSSERKTIESFITFQTNHFLFYFNNIAPFFTYYLTSSTFRKEFKTMFCKWQQNQQRNLTSNQRIMITD